MIEGIGGPPPPRAVAGRARAGERFVAVTQEAWPAAAPMEAGDVGDVGAAALGGFLAMQEAEADAASDREARRGGEDMLRELAGLQRDLLGDGASPAGLGRLENLAARARPAADKGLRGVLDAIGLRARVELARYAADAQRSQR